MDNIAEKINVLGAFCAKKELSFPGKFQLRDECGIDQADVMVLFGGSIIYGGDLLAEAIRNGIAKKYVIVGGEGHTTATLREKMQQVFPEMRTDHQTEAEIFDDYLNIRYGLHADLLECRSTNCGNNITFLLELLRQNHIDCQSIILSQDSTMQRRMDAGLRKYVGEDWQIINCPVYSVRTVVQNGELVFEQPVSGMWEMKRYISLLMGEIPRLRDDRNGYGPAGKGFIAHVNIPPEVEEAFGTLSQVFPELVRDANPLYASR